MKHLLLKAILKFCTNKKLFNHVTVNHKALFINLNVIVTWRFLDTKRLKSANLDNMLCTISVFREILCRAPTPLEITNKRNQRQIPSEQFFFL